jgi:Holliday junction DNA helicase RuvA
MQALREILASSTLCPMISRISGTLESLEGLEAIIQPASSGLSYQVLLPAYLAERLRPQVGRPITLQTLEYLEGQGQGSSYIPRLLGFASTHERRFFDLLTSVDGFGNRKALRALAQEPASIARAIAGSDAAWLSQLPEIGKKTAEKVILELKGKVQPFLTPDEIRGLNTAAAPITGPAEEAIAALITLGETRPEAERKVRAAILKAPGLATTDQILAAAYGG